jgi:hypothetical protein
VILVVQADVELALERSLTTDEVGAVDTGKLAGRIRKASNLVEGYLGTVYATTDVVPQVVTDVTAGVIARLYVRDKANGGGSVPLFADSKSANMGPFNANLTFNQDATSGGPWLTKADKQMLTNVFSGYRGAEMQTDRAYPVGDCDA